MLAHAITIGVVDIHVTWILRDRPTPRSRWYRWRCSCGEHGPNAVNARIARNGGARHVAAMERGKR